MLGAYSDHRSVFVEVTKTEHEHGGPGWEFGTCLWSPEKNKIGRDLYRLMREVEAADLVLHVLHDSWGPGEQEHRIVGFSYAASGVETRSLGPPQPGDWAGQAPYYRVPLRDFTIFPMPISLASFIPLYEKELREDLITHPMHYPFILYDEGRQVRLRQGGYINFCTPSLFDLVRLAVGDESAGFGGSTPPSNPLGASADREFRETKRLSSERYAFARNPGLIRDARAIRGFQCEACDFDFEAVYGELGHEYIECHHVDPLGHRDNPSTTTTVRDVRMLSANCHRMVHRKRPPLAVEGLRKNLGLAPRSPLPALGPSPAETA